LAELDALILELSVTVDTIATAVGAAADWYTVVGIYTVLNSFAADGVATAPITVSVMTAAGAVTVMYTSAADALAATVCVTVTVPPWAPPSTGTTE
jgi:membrane associated rhomboid family serine protease